MVVRANDGVAITQRQHPRMALVEVALDATSMLVTAGDATLRTDLVPRGPRRRVVLFGQELEAVDAGEEAAAFFSRWLGEPALLTYMPDDVVRPVEEPYSRKGDRVFFADGYPVLVASSSSLAALNAAIAARRESSVSLPLPLSMNRFRPNVVVSGAEAWVEDGASAVRIGDLDLRTPKRCARCAVVTVDQETAAVGKEPLRTLAQLRPGPNNVYFAMNAIPDLGPGGQAEIAVGDAVTFG
jgi:uncharacterized protein YcbX